MPLKWSRIILLNWTGTKSQKIEQNVNRVHISWGALYEDLTAEGNDGPRIKDPMQRKGASYKYSLGYSMYSLGFQDLLIK